VKVLHVFDHSLPHHSGYAFRSECILKAQRDLGIQTVQLTGPKHVHEGKLRERIGDLEFRRTPQVVAGTGLWDQAHCVTALRHSVRKAIRDERPDLVHCHSPCLNALAALGLGVPVVYEIRACWEDAAVSSGTTAEGSVRYRASRALETFTARSADQLVVICDGLRREFVGRGMSPSRVATVGNAVNPDALPPTNPDAIAELRRRLGIQGNKVLGFFGSFYEYEGLELLMDALPAVLTKSPQTSVLLAGGGESERAIKAAILRHGLEHHVKLLGRVPHEEIGKCYGVADVMVFPRLPMKLTHMVTPLKPLEAMYLETVVVASDVGGHRELVRHRETGMLFEAGNQQALADVLVEVLNDSRLADHLLKRGREYVVAERLWPHMAERYRIVYEHLLGGRSVATAMHGRS
jgi:PEP-CTERM/exosortase A-associated glycosyltransferase